MQAPARRSTRKDRGENIRVTKVTGKDEIFFSFAWHFVFFQISAYKKADNRFGVVRRRMYCFRHSINGNLSGRGPSILLRKTVLSLKSPTGAFIAPLRCANANLSGRGPSILLRKTVRSLKSPTGAFIAALRFANANNALFALHKILHRLA